MTKYQELILAIVNEAPRHLSAEEICRRARERAPRVSVATVYNALAALTAGGHIARLRGAAGGPDLYDRTTAPHAHRLCPICGRMRDLPIPALADALAALTGQKEPFYELYVHDPCPTCLQN